MRRRELLGSCGALAISGCTFLETEDERAPSLGDPEQAAWPTYRGTVAQTGRANTAVAPPYEVEAVRVFGESLSERAPSNPTPTTGLAVSSGAIYATAVDERFPPQAVDRRDGDLLWRLDELLDQHRDDEFFRTPVPVAVGDDVFVQTKYNFARIHGSDGSFVWQSDVAAPSNGPVIGNQSGLYYPGSVSVVDPRSGEVLGSHRFRETGVFEGVSVDGDRAIAAVRTEDGASGLLGGYGAEWSLRWQDDSSRPFFEAPAIHDGTAICLADANAEPIRGSGAETIAYDLATGAVRWHEQTPEARTGVALDEAGTVYLPHESSGLLALDANDGSEIWAADRPLSSLVGDPDACYPPIVADNAVVLSGRGGLAILDREDGALRHHVDRPLFGMPAVAFGDVYAITDREILAIRGGQ